MLSGSGVRKFDWESSGHGRLDRGWMVSRAWTGEQKKRGLAAKGP